MLPWSNLSSLLTSRSLAPLAPCCSNCSAGCFQGSEFKRTSVICWVCTIKHVHGLLCMCRQADDCIAHEACGRAKPPARQITALLLFPHASFNSTTEACLRQLSQVCAHPWSRTCFHGHDGPSSSARWLSLFCLCCVTWICPCSWTWRALATGLHCLRCLMATAERRWPFLLPSTCQRYLCRWEAHGEGLRLSLLPALLVQLEVRLHLLVRCTAHCPCSCHAERQLEHPPQGCCTPMICNRMASALGSSFFLHQLTCKHTRAHTHTHTHAHVYAHTRTQTRAHTHTNTRRRRDLRAGTCMMRCASHSWQ